MHDDLFGGLGGDAAKVHGRQRVHQKFSNLSVGFGFFRLVKGQLGGFVFHLVNHFYITRELNFSGITVHFGANIKLVSVFRTPGFLDRHFHGFDNFLAFNTLFTRYRVGDLDQIGQSGRGCGGFHIF